MRIRGILLALAAAAAIVGCRAAGPDVPLPATTPFPPELATEVHAIRDQAAEARELAVADGITEGTITRDQLASYYEQIDALSRENDEGELAAWNAAYRLLQMIGPGEDVLEEYTSDRAADVVGMYFLDGDELILVDDGDGSLDLEDDITLAHEYVHSFQDAAFDIDHLLKLAEKEKDDKLNTEYNATVEALMEGDAQIASVRYLGLKLGQEGFTDWLQASAEAAAGGGEPDESAIDRYAYFPYREGLVFVLYLWWKGGWEQVNDAYADPPKTTEQVLHPEKYFAHEEALALKLPDISGKLGDDWQQMDDSVFGEFDVYNFLRTKSADDAGARQAAAGWGGGRLATYVQEEGGDRVLLHLVLSWDTSQDAFEFTQAFRAHISTLEDEQHQALNWSSQDLQSAKVLWDGEDEHVYAWADGQTFRAIFAVEQSDLDQAMSILDPGVTRDTILADLASQ